MGGAPVDHPSFTRAKALEEPWREHFPKDATEAKAFLAHTQYRCLAPGVLIVMQTRIECTWAAYCAVVPNMNHDDEFKDVLRHGDKLPEDVARAIFPGAPPVPYAH